jgi:hypothetical protein
MKGLEPSTFCMASASYRSLPFAVVRSTGLSAGVAVQASEHDRTRANAEPCHSCHASFGIETLLSQADNGARYEPIITRVGAATGGKAASAERQGVTADLPRLDAAVLLDPLTLRAR